MTIEFKCSACSTNLKVADNLAGKKCKCASCAAVNNVPDAAASQAAVAEESSTNRKKGKTKKGSNWLLIGGGLAVLVLGLSACSCCSGGFAIYYFWFSGFDDLKYMPNEVSLLTSERVDQVLNSPAGKEKKQFGFQGGDALKSQHGLGNNNIDRVTSGTGLGNITVITTLSSVDAAEIASKLGGSFTETKVGSYTMMESKGAGKTFCVVGRKKVIYGDAKTVRTVLERDQAPKLSEQMQSGLNKADFTNSVVMVMVMHVGKMPGLNVPLAEIIITEGNYSNYSSTITMRQTLIYPNETDAASVRKQAEDNVTVRQQMAGQGFKNVRVGGSGKTVILEGTE